MTLKWQNLDALSGKVINCNGVRATYSIEPDQNRARWKDVYLASLKDMNQEVAGGSRLKAFDEFSYSAMDTAFLAEAMYRNIPPEQQDLAKWLVSDAVQMQGLAWYIFDSLSYNKEFMPKLLEGFDISFKNWVTFSSRYQKLIWTGIGRHREEICAIVKFESLYNPVEIDNETVHMNGRSLYYGEMWISLEDKQVEYASMAEDVVMKLTGSRFPEGPFIDLQREIVFSKVN